MRRFVVIACLVIAGSAGCAAEHPQHPWLGIAIDEAKGANKPLVVEFYADWCKPCRLFADAVLPDPRVKAALADVMFLRYNIDSATGRDAMKRCRVRGIPTVVGIDHAGFVRVKKTGTEPTADEFLVFLRQARQALTSSDPPPDR